MTYDSWKATNPDDQFLGPEPMEETAMRYYVTHTDEHGEWHQVGPSFAAASPEDALRTLLEQAGAEDDGHYEVHEEDVEDQLCHEYSEWMEAHGLSLGSADEHLFDETLTQEQRGWLRDFCDRWGRLVGHAE